MRVGVEEALLTLSPHKALAPASLFCRSPQLLLLSKKDKSAGCGWLAGRQAGRQVPTNKARLDHGAR